MLCSVLLEMKKCLWNNPQCLMSITSGIIYNTSFSHVTAACFGLVWYGIHKNQHDLIISSTQNLLRRRTYQFEAFTML